MIPCPICHRPVTPPGVAPMRGDCTDPGSRECLVLCLELATAKRDKLQALIAKENP